MCVGNFICLLKPRLLRVMCIKAMVLEEKIFWIKIVCLTVVHLLLIKTMSEEGLFI